MNIVYELLKKISYLKPTQHYNNEIIAYFFRDNLSNYFNNDDKFEITINLKQNFIELTNLTNGEEYIIDKKDNCLCFSNKKEILFVIKNDGETYSCVNKERVKTIKTKEQYSLMNENNDIVALTDLKVKISDKDYFELKNSKDKTHLVGLGLDDDNLKYDKIFSYLENNLKKDKKGVRRRILNLF